MNVPAEVTRHRVRIPYCEPSIFHQSGVWAPLRSPKSPGDVQVPTPTLLTHRLMSEGQSVLVPGTSDDSSRRNSSSATSAFSTLALFGNLYSTYPLSNQISAACTRPGSRKRSGTSRTPMMLSPEHMPHGAETSQLV